MLPWSVIVTRSDSPFAARFREELKKTHPDSVLVTSMDRYHLIHLDAPGPDLVAQRVREFTPDDLRDNDCGLCQEGRGKRGLFGGASPKIPT